MVEAEELTFAALRAINTQRARRWHPGFPQEDGWTGADWSNAMCGEAGETANVVKRLRRAETNVKGALDPERPVLINHLAEEIADTLIYLDLLAVFYGIDLGVAVAAKLNKVSEREGLPERLPVVVSGEESRSSR